MPGSKLPLELPFGPSVEKLIVRLPFGNYASVPGEPGDGGSLGRDEVGGAAHWANNTYESAIVDVPYANRPHGDGPPIAIMIAPDSPIDAVDLWFSHADSSAQRYRVGVGCPLVGLPSDLGQLRASLPHSIPDPWEGSGEASQTWLAENVVFDSISGEGQTSILPADDRAEAGIPCRLWLLRGAAPSIAHVRRAPYSADAFFGLDGATTAYARLWLATLGRASVEVTVCNEGANDLNVTVAGSDPAITIGTAISLQTLHRRRAEQIEDAAIVRVGEIYRRVFAAPHALYSVRIDHNAAAVKAGVAMVARDA